MSKFNIYAWGNRVYKKKKNTTEKCHCCKIERTHKIGKHFPNEDINQ